MGRRAADAYVAVAGRFRGVQGVEVVVGKVSEDGVGGSGVMWRLRTLRTPNMCGVNCRCGLVSRINVSVASAESRRDSRCRWWIVATSRGTKSWGVGFPEGRARRRPIFVMVVK